MLAQLSGIALPNAKLSAGFQFWCFIGSSLYSGPFCRNPKQARLPSYVKKALQLKGLPKCGFRFRSLGLGVP